MAGEKLGKHPDWKKFAGISIRETPPSFNENWGTNIKSILGDSVYSDWTTLFRSLHKQIQEAEYGSAPAKNRPGQLPLEFSDDQGLFRSLNKFFKTGEEPVECGFLDGNINEIYFASRDGGENGQEHLRMVTFQYSSVDDVLEKITLRDELVTKNGDTGIRQVDISLKEGKRNEVEDFRLIDHSLGLPTGAEDSLMNELGALTVESERGRRNLAHVTYHWKKGKKASVTEVYDGEGGEVTAYFPDESISSSQSVIDFRKGRNAVRVIVEPLSKKRILVIRSTDGGEINFPLKEISNFTAYPTNWVTANLKPDTSIFPKTSLK